MTLQSLQTFLTVPLETPAINNIHQSFWCLCTAFGIFLLGAGSLALLFKFGEKWSKSHKQAHEAIGGLAFFTLLAGICGIVITTLFTAGAYVSLWNTRGNAYRQAEEIFAVLQNPDTRVEKAYFDQYNQLKAVIGYPKRVEKVETNVLGNTILAEKTIHVANSVTIDKPTIDFLAQQDLKISCKFNSIYELAKTP